MEPTLFILAAGMGSRFGGLKQVTPVGPSDETIIDYSIYDAIKAGFGKVVFVIRESFADAFKEKFDILLKGKIEVAYVFQELENLPKGYSVPEGREKPWGTGHAILMGKQAIHEPFAVINADDFYGFPALKAMADFLFSSKKENEYAMVGYNIGNTLSENGTVSRGICETDANNLLTQITETHQIEKKGGNTICVDKNGKPIILKGDEVVSMNIWGANPNIFDYLEKAFIKFLDENIAVPKSEFYIPSVVFDLINAGKIKVKVLEANSPWFGVTYKEDHPFVTEQVKKMVDNGDYPSNLWG